MNDDTELGVSLVKQGPDKGYWCLGANHSCYAIYFKRVKHNGRISIKRYFQGAPGGMGSGIRPQIDYYYKK
ncbi:hypothetical protein [Apilactobacillus ozensis]|uniref:hypothetical protein n=1 Tax=Apilactobacillus ozensis TaxID=866801 RepID=UPI002009FB12|nr:hypothetical protein [Apilactobacillus ozensis]MCK8607247.1 hypothetical protein [Apilactobacillus ozensis]